MTRDNITLPREVAEKALSMLNLLGLLGENVADRIRAALAEPKQEPVAWMVYTLDGKSVCVTDNPADFTDQHRALPLYTAAQEVPR